MNAKTIWLMLKQTASDWVEDKAPQLGAALAFYSLLSIAPLLLIAISIAGLVFGEEAARGGIEHQIEDLVGEQGAQAVEDMLAHAKKPGAGILATVTGIATLLFGASGVFGQLQDSLNTIWEVRPKPGGGVWGFLRTRFLSFAMVLGVGFLLLVSLVLSAGLAAIGNYLGDLLPAWGTLVGVLNFVISFLVITLLFALIFKLLPDVKIAWKDVWFGAALTAALFTIGKFLIGLYLGYASVESSYGAAGSLVVFVLWVYYSAQILFFGAEFTQVYARMFGSRIEPSAHAEPIEEARKAKRDLPAQGGFRGGKPAAG